MHANLHDLPMIKLFKRFNRVQKHTKVSELYFQIFEEKTDNKESATCFFLQVEKAQINH